MEAQDPARYRRAIVQLIGDLNKQLSEGRWSIEQRLALGRAERWIIEALQRADDAGKPPKRTKKQEDDD